MLFNQALGRTPPFTAHFKEMVTITANDSSAEFIAHVRRGPFAMPASDLDSACGGNWGHEVNVFSPSCCHASARPKDENEQIEYLLSRKRALRAPAERHSVLHVLSYQRRVNAIKNIFFARDSKTPLGYSLHFVAAAFLAAFDLQCRAYA